MVTWCLPPQIPASGPSQTQDADDVSLSFGMEALEELEVLGQSFAT